MKAEIWLILILFNGISWSEEDSLDSVIVHHKNHLQLNEKLSLTCQGLCISVRTCTRLGGVVNSACAHSDAICCQFETGCKGSSAELESFWHSPGYPAPTVGTLLCQFVLHLHLGVCGVRLDFLEFNTTRPLDRGLCHMDQLLILDSLDGPAFPRCGELTGYSTIVPVDPKLPLKLLSILQSSTETFKWNIRMTQLKCQSAIRIKDYPGCGLKVNGSSESNGEKENTVATDEGELKEGKVDAPDNYFFIQYLKRAHEALVEGTNVSNANNTLCKNMASDIAAEKLKERIIRGQDALPNEFPWQVSIQDVKGHICGGAIISSRIVLTAAHCFLSLAPLNLRNIHIIIGDLNLNITTETNHSTMSLHSILFHSHFDPYYLKNDIAVIRLKKDIVFRTGVAPICLPDTDKKYSGFDAVISGWGAVNYPLGKLATHLQRVDNKIIDNEECKKRLKVDYIFPTMLCAVAPNCSGTCFGDSGGSLVVETSPGGRRQVVGIVSFGIGGCALLPYWPDVYTRVSEYLNWLSYATLSF